jgi:hypothetical protein
MRSWVRGLVTPAIGHQIPLNDAAEAMRVVHERRRAVGSVVIEMSFEAERVRPV